MANALNCSSISIQEFLCVSTPYQDPKKVTNSFSFLIGIHTKFFTIKRKMVIPLSVFL